MHDACDEFNERVPPAKREGVPDAAEEWQTVRLVHTAPEHTPVRLGVLRGQIELGPDFDDPLPEFGPYAGTDDQRT